MLASGSLHQGMYNILQEWYEFIHANIHIQADLIGELPLMNIIASEIYFYVFFCLLQCTYELVRKLFMKE